MNKHTRFAVLCAIIVALTAVTSFFPFVFLLPLIITAASFKNIRLTMFSAFAFGIISFLYALMGQSLVALCFVANPLIPIVPRILVGLITHFTTKLKIKKQYLHNIIVAATASVSNTLLVIGALVLLTPNMALDGVNLLGFVPVLFLYGLIELAVNIAVAPLTANAVSKIKFATINN